MNRGERLNERFKIIQQTLTELYGGKLAFAAASAAWLMAIQYAAKQSMKRIQGSNAKPAFGEADNVLIQHLDAAHELLLRGFHKELCEFLGVSPAHAEDLAKAFQQVVEDICNQGG